MQLPTDEKFRGQKVAEGSLEAGARPGGGVSQDKRLSLCGKSGLGRGGGVSQLLRVCMRSAVRAPASQEPG